MKRLRAYRGSIIASFIAGTVLVGAAAPSADAQPNYLTVLDRPATQTQANIAQLLGCMWNANSVYAECNNIRQLGVDLVLHLNPIDGTIDNIEIMAFLTKPDLNPDQLNESDQTVIGLVDYFLANWPGHRSWIELALTEARGRRADTTMTFDDVVLTSAYLWAFRVDGERVVVDIRRKN